MAAKKPVTSKELLVPPKGPGVQLLQAPRTFKLARSSVLSQVRSFLPELARANTALQERVESEGLEGVAVECSEEEEQQTHIEMDLALVPLSCTDGDDDVSCSDSSSQCSSEEDERPAAVDDNELISTSAATALFPLRLPSSCRPSHCPAADTRPHGNKTRLIEELVTE